MSAKPHARCAAVALALLAAMTLAGCGEGQPDETATGGPTSSSSAPGGEKSVPRDTPECSEVWVDGETIKRPYRGCVQDGDFVEPDVRMCSSGQRVVRYADRFYAFLGGRVYELTSPLLENPKYKAMIRRCTA